MRLLICSDMHDLQGFANLYQAISVERPDVVLSCGDFGSNLPTQKRHVLAHYSPEFLKLTLGQYEDLFKPILEKIRLVTCYGNHDILDVLYALRNTDGTPCLLETFRKTPLTISGARTDLQIVGINGNISGKENPWNTAVTKLRKQYKKHKPTPPIDIVLSHEAIYHYQPKGHEALLEFFDLLQPRFWFSGHTHVESDSTVDHYDRELDRAVASTRLIGLGMLLLGKYSTLDTETGKVEQKKIE